MNANGCARYWSDGFVFICVDSWFSGASLHMAARQQVAFYHECTRIIVPVKADAKLAWTLLSAADNMQYTRMFFCHITPYTNKKDRRRSMDANGCARYWSDGFVFICVDSWFSEASLHMAARLMLGFSPQM